MNAASRTESTLDSQADPAADVSADMLLRLLDALDFGMLLVEPDGRVRFANRAAREALATDERLRIEDGRLAIQGTQPQRVALAGALADAAAGTPRLLCLGRDVPRTKLALAPWDLAADGTPLLLGTLQTGERKQWPALRAYARERRLTEGETDVMQALVLGDSPPQIAARRGSTEGTVRSQIKTLLEKTGTHGMRELVVEVLHLPPMAGHASIGPVRASSSRGAARARVESSFRDRAIDRGTTSNAAGARAEARDPLLSRDTRELIAARDARLARDAQTTRNGARLVRNGPPMDRGALLALCASQFAWPPSA